MEYDNIDFRTNILFDACYVKKPLECYKFDPIIKKNISLIDIKEPIDFDQSNILKKKK